MWVVAKKDLHVTIVSTVFLAARHGSSRFQPVAHGVTPVRLENHLTEHLHEFSGELAAGQRFYGVTVIATESAVSSLIQATIWEVHVPPILGFIGDIAPGRLAPGHVHFDTDGAVLSQRAVLVQRARLFAPFK